MKMNIFCLYSYFSMCGPRIFALWVPIQWRDSLFIYLVKIWFLEKDLESPLILIFFKGKTIKKKNHKCDSWRKTSLWKTESGSEGQVTYWEGMTVRRNTPLSPIIRSLLNKVGQVWQLIRKLMDTNEIIK